MISLLSILKYIYSAWNIQIDSATVVNVTRDQSEAALNLGITTLTTTEKVNVQPLFIYEICVDPQETVINQKEVDERNAEIASWKPPEDDKEAVCELEDIEPVVGQVFRYSYSLKEATSAVHLAFDDCLSSKYFKRRSEHANGAL